MVGLPASLQTVSSFTARADGLFPCSHGYKVMLQIYEEWDGCECSLFAAVVPQFCGSETHLTHCASSFALRFLSSAAVFFLSLALRS